LHKGEGKKAMDDTRVLTFLNPATGETFGQVAMASQEYIRQTICDLRAQSKTWSGMPVRERVRILGKLQEVMIDAADEITAVLNQDTGKSRQDALIELWMTVDLLKVYRSHAERWLRRQVVPRGYFFFKHCYFEQRPYGLVLVISPWNYPFYLSMPPVIAALLAGNTVILKPSEVTAASGVLIEDIFKRVPELAPYVRVVHGDGEVGAALVKAAPDYIFVTGSTLTGRKVMAAAAENLVPVACELGGKDAVIILEDADIEKAARWTVWGAFFNTGQTCIAVSRVYVVESRYDEFVARAMHHRNLLKIGYSSELESNFYLGPMTDPRQLKTIERHMEDALAKGARLQAGGKRDGMFYEPVVLTEVDHSMLIMREETFGPILPIMKVKDEAEAIRMANDSNFGLGASIWSNNIHGAERVAHQVQAGAVLVNDSVAQIAIPMLPFGGIKHSGYGRIHGKAGLLQFTEPYSYAVSNPPTQIDIGVILREPGHYRTGYRLLHLLFGANLRQKLLPFLDGRKEPAGRQRSQS
jgi:acyl-CoA reductase-like NAD-dependent aldehyde dehydrogenase